MEHMKRLILLVPICFICAFSTLTTSDAEAALDVVVSIAPQQWLVDRLGGEAVHSEVLSPAGQDPHSFEPRPRQIAHLAKARLYFTIGLPFEKRLREKIEDAGMPVRQVDSAAGIGKIPLIEHEHEEGAEHDEDDDPHVWLSPAGLMIMAENIAQALTTADPGNAQLYATNLARVRQELTALNQQIAARLKPFAGATFYVFHPSFGYFAHEYGLRQEAVEIEGKSPSPKQLQHLIAKARQDGARVIFTQPEFEPKSAEAVAQAIGGQVVPLDPLAYDVAENLKLMAASIADALSDE
ncbi:MAG TPA: ABC transporter substrate-binding protein [Desulfobulbaceae bacterium]|nr:ABC transporter substrate-binding protein [Desulfobulbaceae bacterium]